MLYHPSDIGIAQSGIAECLVQAAESCHPDIRDALFANILVAGGTTLLPNFEERLCKELRELVSADCMIRVTQVSEPLVAAWRGGSIFAASELYESQVS